MRLTVRIPAGFAVVLILLLGSAAGCTEFNASAPPGGTAAEKPKKTIHVTAAQSNAGPVAGDIAETAVVGVRRTITLEGSTPDDPGMQLTYVIRSLPANGTLVDPVNTHMITTADVQQAMGYALANCGNQLEFTATSGGTMTFSYVVHDGMSVSTEAKVTIAVTAAPKRATSVTRPTGDAYTGTDSFTFTAHNGDSTSSEATVTVTVTAAPHTMMVTPADGVAFAGPVGGPFTPAGATFSLVNTGTANIAWSVSNSPAWMTLAPNGGVLRPGDPPIQVSAGLSADAASLPAGTYNGTLRFTNLTNNDGNTTRSVQLTIQASQPTGTDSPAPDRSRQAPGSQ